jgi:hypothetical protein
MKIYILYKNSQRIYLSSELEDIVCKVRQEIQEDDWLFIYREMRDSINEKGYWTYLEFTVTEREYEAF